MPFFDIKLQRKTSQEKRLVVEASSRQRAIEHALTYSQACEWEEDLLGSLTFATSAQEISDRTTLARLDSGAEKSVAPDE